jgi:nucleotide-binding universal stress UspA family protein
MLRASTQESTSRRPREVITMRRFLVVANQTLGGAQLLDEVRARIQAGPCQFHVLVPATPTDQLDPGYLQQVAEHLRHARAAAAADTEERRLARLLLEDEVQVEHAHERAEDDGRALARQRLREALERLRALGADASGEVGVADPVEAIEVTMHRHEFDEIILSTLPGTTSRWLAADLPRRVRRAFKLPVTEITGPSSAQG